MGERRRLRPQLFHGLLALALALLGAAALLLVLRQPPEGGHALVAWLLAVNVTAFGYYGYDKRQARRGGRRVPELVLHVLVFVGGTVGAYLAMRAFRHKTIKGPFRLAFWVFAALQLALVVAVLYRLWGRGPA